MSMHCCPKPCPRISTSLILDISGQLTFRNITEQSTGLVAREADRLESRLETCRKLEDTIPDLIRKNGELLAALEFLKGESDSLGEAYQCRIAALEEKIASLNTAIDVQREKASKFRSKIPLLKQQVDDLNSTKGLFQAADIKQCPCSPFVCGW